MQSAYETLSLSKILFSAIAGLRVSSIIASVLLLSLGVLTVIPQTITTVIAAPDNNTSPTDNPNSLVNKNGIDKQTVGSQKEDKTDQNDNKDNSKNDGSSTSSQQNFDPTTLPFPIPSDHSKKIKTNHDSGSHVKDKHNSNGNNYNNHNENSKGKDKTTTTPLRLPFP
jgi:hypothetical protein